MDARHLLFDPAFDPLRFLGNDHSQARPRFKSYGPYYLWQDLQPDLLFSHLPERLHRPLRVKRTLRMAADHVYKPFCHDLDLPLDKRLRELRYFLFAPQFDLYLESWLLDFLDWLVKFL